MDTALAIAGLHRETSYSFPHRLVSISHTAHVSAVAVAIAPVPGPLLGVGIDIEAFRDCNPGTARFFLDEDELAWLASVPAPARAGEHLRMWTSKEALFKCDPGNRETVLRDYTLLRPEANTGCALRRPAASNGVQPRFGYISAELRDTHLSFAASFDTAKPISGRDMPTSTITFDAVAERISATLSVPRENLSPDSALEDLAADSFMLVEMVVDLQEEFDSMFTQTELRQITRLGQLVDLLQSQHS